MGKITASAACTVRISGDSRVTILATAMTRLLSPFPTLTLTSVVNSGKNTNDWVTTYLAADIAAAPDVLVWYWGMNDCAGLSRTLAQFETDLRAGLTTYRATVPATSGAVILVVPNATSDGTNGRDPAWAEKMRHIIRVAAEDFACGFVDSYALFQDAYNSGIGGTYPWLDDTFSDGIRGIHPQASFSRVIAGSILDVMIPSGFRQYWGGPGLVSNLANADKAPAVADAVTTYPLGISICRATTANSWPVDGFVMTIRHQDAGGGMQIHWSNNSSYSGSYTRISRPGAWEVWVSMTSPFPNPSTTVATSDALSTYPFGFSVSRATPANGWGLDGYVWTYKQSLDGNYAFQDLHAYNADVPMLRRQWTSAAVWGVWRRIGNSQGAIVASANNLVLTDDYCQISGATQINLLASTNWTGGAVVTMKFNSTPTVKHNTAVSGVNKPIILNGAVDFVAAASNTLTLRYDSTDAVWYEQSRKV